MTQPAPPPDPRDRARSAGAARADRRRAVRSGHLRVHRGRRRPSRSPPDGDRSVGGREPAVGEVRHAAAVAAARAWSTRSRTTAATAGAMCGCSRSARASRPRGETRGGRDRVDRHGDRRALVGRRARGRLLRRQGRRRAALRARSACRSASSRRASRISSPGQAASIVVADGAERARRSASSASWRRRSPTRAALPRQDRVVVAELDLDALDRARARHAERRGACRCRGIRSSSAICRSSSRHLACGNHSWHHSQRPARDLPAPLVASTLLRSLSGQRRAGRRGQPVGAADVPGGRPHTDRRRGAARASTTILAALVREHGAVQR